MKNKTLIITFLSVAAFAAGCDRETGTSQQIEKVETKTTAAAQEMKDYTYAQKAEFVENMQNQLAAINRDLDQLSAKVEKAGDAAKAEAQPKLQALREKADQLAKQLDQARNVNESTWDSVKATSRKAYNELTEGFNEARQWVSDKIAP